jgi:hypothetical protein
MAAIRFSGLAGDDALAENQAKLLDYLKRQGLSPKGKPQYAFYDPPWTLPWIWRGNLDEKSATIWMRFFGRGDEMIVAERQ